MLRRSLVLLSSSVAFLGLAAHSVLACPPLRSAHSGSSFSELFFPLLLLLGVPALVFRTLAPPLLPFRESRKLWPLQAWGALLGAFLLATLSFRDWRKYVGRVAESVRQKVMFESRHPAFRRLAQEAPWVFPRATVLATVSALLAVVAMWVWTAADPDVSWGQGMQVPVLFSIDTLLTFVTVRWLTLRVSVHLAQSMLGTPSWFKGMAMAVRAGVLGGAAGWVWGALFGMSSGVQTYVCLGYSKLDVIPLLAGWYGIHALLLGGMLGLVLAMFMAWPRSGQDTAHV